MTERSVSLILVIVTGAMLALIFGLSNRDVSGPSRAEQLAVDLNALSPSAAGIPSTSDIAPPIAPRSGDGYIGGSKATGRVAGIYLKVNQGVFLALERAPETLRKTAERYVDVQFPDLLANGSGAARAFLSDAQASVGVGDIVEVKFAHKGGKDSASFFPVKEITRVTEVVAKRGEMLATDFEQRIMARTGPGAAAQTQLGLSAPAVPQWLAPQGASAIALPQGKATVSLTP
jgi:hypothetical protein